MFAAVDGLAEPKAIGFWLLLLELRALCRSSPQSRVVAEIDQASRHFANCTRNARLFRAAGASWNDPKQSVLPLVVQQKGIETGAVVLTFFKM